MSEAVKRRRYDSSRRSEAAEQTRLAVLRAAHGLFLTQGFAGTTVAQVARTAGVSVDTVYASVGRKPQLLLAVHDMELAESDQPLDAEQRDYVRQIRAARTAHQKLRVYAHALARLLPRTVPLLVSLRDAGHADPACREAYQAVLDRRAANMRLLATDLRRTGQLRDDLDDEAVADLVWTTNSPEYFLLLQSRGYSPQQYAAHVLDVWTHTLLRRRPRRAP